MILCILCEGEKSVTEIEHALGLRQPTVSQQLARPGGRPGRGARSGKAIHYSIASENARIIVGAVHEVFCKDVKG